MSNKMFTKRLLAAGLSMAMSATLFATNSITTFAEEEIPSLSEPIEVAPAEEPSFPQPVETSETKVEEYEDYVVITTTETTDYYRSDMNSTDFEGNQADYYLPVNAEDTAGQTLDYKNTYTDGVTGYDHDGCKVLKDSNGDLVTVPTESGEEVILELDSDFNIEEDAQEVLVVENKDGDLEIVEEDEKIFYGYFDENGNFVEAEDGDAYILTSGDNYELLGTAYTTIVNGEKVILDEEIYKALTGDENAIYTAEKEYDYRHFGTNTTTSYSAENLAKKQDVLEVDDENWNYTLGRSSTAVKLNEDVEYYKAVVESYNLSGQPYARFYFVGQDGKTYYNIKTVYGYGGVKPKPGDTLENYKKTDHVGKDSKTYATTETVYIRVYDKDTGELKFECDKAAYENLKAENFVKVAGNKIAVEDKNENTVLLDVDTYEEVFAYHDVVSVTNVYYYTVQDKYEKAPITVDLEFDDKEYQLTVAFWENNRIGAQSVEVSDNHDGTIKVKVNFAYASIKEGYFGHNYPSTEYSSAEFDVDKNIFGQDGTAKMKIKYTPSYNGVVNRYDFKQVLAATGLDDQMVTAKLVSLAAEKDSTFINGAEKEYAPGRVFPIIPGFTYSVDLGEPDMVTENNDQPAPPQRNDIEYIPRDPDADSPVVVALSTAPGQVLGAVREEATGEAPAVLGASRARGTADETTAPFVRVIVMAAVASAALFLTRKREEEN